MSDYATVEQQFNNLGADFLKDFRNHTFLRTYEAKAEILAEGQLVKFVPIVVRGLVKVYSANQDRELLHYFIKPEQSCILTFSAIFKDGRSIIFSCTEEETEMLMLPVDQVSRWIVKYPAINHFFYRAYDLRYSEMMESVNKVIFYRLDQRVMDYLENKIKLTGKNPVKMSHKEIAASLGTAREVVSRILKKFEHEGNIRQNSSGIEVISRV
ncbi:MAG: Crp/Fnr family transcriptional regulator [Weeksellaceae bacterium]|nr:Crp/Fnr family transcriptional regulator [Weeksellaceae bacterium]